MDALEAAQLDKVAVNAKGCVPEDVKVAFFRKLRMKNDNRTCFECSQRGPQWLSITYGVFLCLDCAGRHRLKGSHISFVRGVELDQFKPAEIVRMAVCGNAKALAYFKTHGMGKTSETGKAIDYSSSCAQRYKQQIETDMGDACKQCGYDLEALKAEVASEAASASPTALSEAATSTSEVAAAAGSSAISAAANIECDFLDSLTAAKLNEQPLSEKGFVSEEVRNAFFRKMRLQQENRSCFECPARGPQWLSITYGVFLCLDCAGQHRLKGVHLSFVRGAELDQFTPEQIVQMGVGGNRKAHSYFKTKGLGKTSDSGRAIKYDHRHTVAYKEQILRETAAMCRKLGLKGVAADSSPAADSAKTGDATPSSVASAPAPKPAAAPPPVVTPQPAAAVPSQPKSVIVRRAEAPTTTVIRKAAPPTTTVIRQTENGNGYNAAAARPPAAQSTDFDFNSLENNMIVAEPAKKVEEIAPAAEEAPVEAKEPEKPAPAPAPAKPKAEELDFDFDF
eukprot:TRINITY_DN20623_c0_g1_i1.p1 TRINITY_DN20623_c0_g1~~TRINITY_DN20623_c0_g1_i1.p1  ORF type:complete len:508 (+),score=125.80 TRINITY_DN20623_c0_g1_i1:108-1631(+)